METGESDPERETENCPWRETGASRDRDTDPGTQRLGMQGGRRSRRAASRNRTRPRKVEVRSGLTAAQCLPSLCRARSPGRHLTSSLQGAEVLIHINAVARTRGCPSDGAVVTHPPSLWLPEWCPSHRVQQEGHPSSSLGSSPSDQRKPARAVSPQNPSSSELVGPGPSNHHKAQAPLLLHLTPLPTS